METQQKNLSKEEIEQARFYSKNGYLVLKNAVPNENVNEARQVLETDLNHHFSKDNPRALNLWKQSKVLKHLAFLVFSEIPFGHSILMHLD